MRGPQLHLQRYVSHREYGEETELLQAQVSGQNVPESQQTSETFTEVEKL